MRRSRNHRRFRLTAIQRSDASEHEAIEASRCQCFLGQQYHLAGRCTALAAKAENEQPAASLIADIHMHQRDGPPKPHDHNAPGSSTARGFEAVWTAPDEAP